MTLHSIAALMARSIASPPRAGIPAMTSILSVPIEIPAQVHESLQKKLTRRGTQGCIDDTPPRARSRLCL